MSERRPPVSIARDLARPIPAHVDVRRGPMRSVCLAIVKPEKTAMIILPAAQARAVGRALVEYADQHDREAGSPCETEEKGGIL